MSEATDWAAALERQREQKDQSYAEHPRSPRPSDHRERFEGLGYFEPDPELRFELPLHEHDDPEPITVETTTEGAREYRRWGEFRFPVDGTEQTLQAYKAQPGEDRLWVPFRDASSGEVTYGGGRYLDLEADEHRTADGEWALDFNRAYNPYCAYSAKYECPLIPMEDWLDVPIEAGEKAYEPRTGRPRTPTRPTTAPRRPTLAPATALVSRGIVCGGEREELAGGRERRYRRPSGGETRHQHKVDARLASTRRTTRQSW